MVRASHLRAQGSVFLPCCCVFDLFCAWDGDGDTGVAFEKDAGGEGAAGEVDG